MGFRLSKTCLIVVAALTMLVPAIFVPSVDAQKQGAPLWEKTVTVKRVQKPDRKPPSTLPETQRVKLLTLQWRVIERGNGNVQKEADPSQVFHNEDQLKLAVTTNQDGYLYVIHRMDNGDGKLVFPDPRSNEGRNDVKKNQEYIVPSYCSIYPDPKDCWWEMAPPIGRESFIVVFSRDEFEKLPRRVTTNNGEYEYPIIKRALFEILTNTSSKNVKEATGRLRIPGKPAARFATWLQNTNLKDNEELIATIQLRHGD